MSNIHPTAAEGFACGAPSYLTGRPEYPPEIEQWLAHELGLSSGKRVLDLGAGTGKFSSRLLATGASVVAIDPVDEMLGYLADRYPQIESRSGTAEAIPLDDASLDAVVCAQSFHWFATPLALREIRRVLRPGGAFGLIWNIRDNRVPWVAQLTTIMDVYQGDIPRFSSQKWRSVFPAEGFSPLRETQFPNHHTGAPERVIVDRILSVSFIAALPHDEQQRVKAQVCKLIETTPELAGRSQVTFPYETQAFVCHRL